MSQQTPSPKILVAPLDWGLGHATRCIPIIRELLLQKCTVLLAASGKGKTLLQQEFPQLKLLDLPGYNIAYASSAWGLAFKIVAQIPKLFSAIKKEQAWLKKVVANERIDAVISDNRYGLHHPGIRSVFVTHQLLIKAPLALAEEILQKANYRYINRFNECWVPDSDGAGALAGGLSHPPKKPLPPLHYTGPLSRFNPKKSKAAQGQLLIVLSGPEPQRTLLEEIILNDLKNYSAPVVFIRGLPGVTEKITVGENITVFNHLSSEALEQEISKAAMVISRCGYSTVMDLAALNKNSILIPTPGQTEQEYLGKYLMQTGFALCIEQKKFRLASALALAATFPYTVRVQTENKLPAVVQGLVKSIKEERGKPEAGFKE